MRALAALLLLATCAPAPPDPMAFETEQTNVALMIEPVAGTNRTKLGQFTSIVSGGFRPRLVRV
jgi:hypothetical protein